MAEQKVKDLIASLQRDYTPDEVVVVSVWSKADVAQVIEDEGYGCDGKSDAEFLEDAWHHISGDVEAYMEYEEEDMNSNLRRFVESYVMRGEK